jgi:hypothetical protein
LLSIICVPEGIVAPLGEAVDVEPAMLAFTAAPDTPVMPLDDDATGLAPPQAAIARQDIASDALKELAASRIENPYPRSDQLCLLFVQLCCIRSPFLPQLSVNEDSLPARHDL